MSALGPQDRALVAHEVAALRAHGWTTGRALALVAGGLPAGRMRTEIEAAAAALEAGRAPASSDDPLVALLSLGDAAGAQALQEAARGEMLLVEAHRSRERDLVVPAFLAAGALLASVALGSTLASGLAEPLAALGTSLPAPTILALEVLRILRFAGPLAAAALVAGALLFPPVWLPGTRRLLTAARLRRFAANLAAGVPEPRALSALGPGAGGTFAGARSLRLGPCDRIAAEHLTRDGDPRLASLDLAQELESEARSLARRARTYGPGLALVCALAFAFFFSQLLVALYFPVFSIAGSIK